MKEVLFTVRDPLGIHARPAGLLVREAQKYESEIWLEAKGRRENAKRLLSVMGLAVKAGDEIRFSIEGRDEAAAEQGLRAFLQDTL